MLEIDPAKTSSPIGDVNLGVFVTLGNPKAILFYSAILPTFFDVSILNFPGFVMVSLIIIVTSFMVYGGICFLPNNSVPCLHPAKSRNASTKVSELSI